MGTRFKKGWRKPDPIDVNASAILRSLRCWRGLSQKNLADKLGLIFQQIQKYESGRNRMSVSTVYQIARALDMPVTTFFAGLEETMRDSGHLRLSEDEIEFLKIYRTVPEGKRKHIMVLAQVLADYNLAGD